VPARWTSGRRCAAGRLLEDSASQGLVLLARYPCDAWPIAGVSNTSMRSFFCARALCMRLLASERDDL
jgi:hypothetical protein